MKEFGSDFHYCPENSPVVKNDLSKSDVSFYANGRQAIQHILLNNSWKRIWIPGYFCYEIVDAIKDTGIVVEFYPDAPTTNDQLIISDIPFEENDVLLRMNFFGLRGFRDNSSIPVDVIEDHSHDLIGSWAIHSNANWCFASLRKTLPLPEGGMLWSPKNLSLPCQKASTLENDLLSYKRLSAMLMKSLYLHDRSVSKNQFRQLFVETEDAFSTLKISSISEICLSMITRFNIQNWYKIKSENWASLSKIETDHLSVLIPENIENCHPFSLILKFNRAIDRELIREILIENEIYPSVLWEIPVYQDKKFIDLSQKLLSIYCDARYSSNDIELLRNKLLTIISVIH